MKPIVSFGSKLNGLNQNSGSDSAVQVLIRFSSTSQIYYPDTKSLDYRKLKVTDMLDNPRVELPTTRPQREEQTLAAKELLQQRQ